MVDVAEVVVRATPDGIDETVDELDDMEGKVSESADSMDDQASKMGGFAQRFRGAMAVAATALAVAGGALLSRVPVIGEAFSGLFAILDAVAFQMDQVLRPVLTPVTDRLFDVADAIFNAEGAFGTFIGIAGTVVAAFATIVVPAIALASQLGLVGSTMGVLIGAAKVLGGALLTLAGAISLPVLIVAALIAALVVLAWVFRDEIANAIGIVVGALFDLASRFDSLVDDAAQWGVDLVRNFIRSVLDFASDVKSAAADIVGSVADAFTDLVSDAKDWGVDLIARFIEGLKSKVGDLRDAVAGAASEIRDRFPGSDAETGPLSDLHASGAALPETFASGIESNASVSRSATENALNGPDDFIGSVGGGSPTINLDGQRVDDGQGRYRKDRLNRRGA